jgi:hypothetical protein
MKNLYRYVHPLQIRIIIAMQIRSCKFEASSNCGNCKGQTAKNRKDLPPVSFPSDTGGARRRHQTSPPSGAPLPLLPPAPAPRWWRPPRCQMVLGEVLLSLCGVGLRRIRLGTKMAAGRRRQAGAAAPETRWRWVMWTAGSSARRSRGGCRSRPRPDLPRSAAPAGNTALCRLAGAR